MIEKSAIRGGVRRIMAKVMKNFHFSGTSANFKRFNAYVSVLG